MEETIGSLRFAQRARAVQVSEEPRGNPVISSDLP